MKVKLGYKKIWSLLLSGMLLLAILLTGCGGENKSKAKVGYSFKDDQGYTTSFEKAPQRIMTLSMGLDNVVLGLVPPERMVAINYLADDGKSSNIVKYGKLFEQKIKKPSVERIMSLRPEVVFVNVWTDKTIITSLRDLGIKVIVLNNPKNLDGVRKNVRAVSQVLQIEAKGEELVGKMDAKLAEIHRKLEKHIAKGKKNVVLLSLMTSYGGSGCIYDDMCKEAGVINGISAIGLKNGQALTKELLLKTKAEILLMPVYNDHGTFDTQGFIKQYTEDPALQPLPAIKNKKFYFPREGYTYNTSQDVVFGIQEIALAAYGEDFAQEDQQHLQVW